MFFGTAHWAEIPVDEISLFLTLVQTLIALIDYVDFEEVIYMTNSLLMESGTHGVVQNWWNVKDVTSAE